MKIQYVLRGALIGVALLFCLNALGAPQRFADADDDVARVYETIDARLALMPEVAAWKWTHQRPVFDEQREREVVAGVVSRAHFFGLAPESVRRLIETQIKIARAVQTELFEQWRERGFPQERTVRELDTDLRPALDTIGNDQLAALYWARAELSGAVVNDSIAKSLRHIASFGGVTAQDLAELRAVLHDFQPDSQTIDTVARLHVLRIGTTGDYAPFSLERAGELSGVDVELGEALAQHLDLQPRFVRTSWKTLLDDLEAGRFDIAMSGISNTPERAARAEFSTAYHFDGKTPIARCEDRNRYESLSAIDQPQVKVIVNPGGTNEQFVRAHIERAQIVVHADNRTIFEELIAGRADVMITDGIEADLQARRHKELCRTTNATLSNTAKGILLTKGSALAKEVDLWLQSEIARGGVQAKLQRALANFAATGAD